ncbi:hypothetical protein AMECASPLE_035995 [Ameca splendens]|uniref:Uncharacterized protein n=1 Tax=Ameca splendens TaxID=208324 RepID=A0ABV0ZGS2_9TELE
MTSEILKCYTIKFRKLPLHSKTTHLTLALFARYSMPLYPPIVLAMRHVLIDETSCSALLIGRCRRIVESHSQGKCLGTPLPSVRGDGEQNSSPEAQTMTPSSPKYAKVTRFLLDKS